MKRLFFTKLLICVLGVAFALCFSPTKIASAYAMPFYDLKPQELTLRSTFFTSFPTSSEERKSNVKLAASSLNRTVVDAGGEFSFNATVGDRTVERGYKKAKIILNGSFTDGIGGGVCQVSTTLYNAVLLAGLKITEYHPHSLPVSYIAPSFDAMVSSGSADLRFFNDTHNPIIIQTECTDSVIRINIYGEPMDYKLVRKSVVTEQISPPSEELVVDINGEFPDLLYGEKRVLSYSKAGFVSQGYIIAVKNGNPIWSKQIRSDKYGGVRGKIVEGRAVKVEDDGIDQDFTLKPNE